MNYTFPATLISLILSLVSTSATLSWQQTQMTLPAEAGEEALVATYRFKNTGTTPVTITNIRSNCGCTVANSDQMTYEPGESGKIELVFTFGERIGPQRKVAWVQTDEPGGPVTELVLETHIPELVTCEPRVLMWTIGEDNAWKSIQIKTEPTYKILINENPDEPLPIKYKLEKSEDPGHYELQVRPLSNNQRAQYPINILVELPDGQRIPRKVFALVR